MFEAIVYFSSPRTLFAGKVQEEDIIARYASPYRFLARTFARSTHSSLDPTRCGYAVLMDGQTIEHVEAIIDDDAAVSDKAVSSELRAPSQKSPRRSGVAAIPHGPLAKGPDK